jgi:histidinol-phosphate aminotransferase
MFDLNKIVRENIKSLKPYSSARDEYQGDEGVFIDANENPFGTYNRYPDAYQSDLKSKIASIKNVSAKNIFIGNGSDEAIDLAIRLFCEPGKDKVLAFTPSYGMYEVSADVNNIEIIKSQLTDDFQINFDDVNKIIEDKSIKVIFVCSPNNPTGNITKDIEKVVISFDGIVIVDEAYIDFCPEYSMLSKLNQYPNMIITQTLSKAWGLAGARVGMAYASENIIALFNRVKPPYNISTLNQTAAIAALDDIEGFQETVATILNQKDRLLAELPNIKCVTKVFPSDANFILVETTDANAVYKKLVDEKIIVRNRNSVIKNCLRITVGNEEENDKLLEQLRMIE